MNNTGSEIRIAYDLAMTTVVKDTSQLLLNGIRRVLYNELGFDPQDLTIHYEPPVSYANEIDVKQVLTINEQRRMLDEDLPMLEDGEYVCLLIERLSLLMRVVTTIMRKQEVNMKMIDDIDKTIIEE